MMYLINGDFVKFNNIYLYAINIFIFLAYEGKQSTIIDLINSAEALSAERFRQSY